MSRGVNTAPADQAFEVSFLRLGLPSVSWRKLVLDAFELKFAGMPAAAQLARRVAGAGPLLRLWRSHGSVAKPKKVLDGMKASWIEGERIAWVKSPRNEMSRTGAQRPPAVHVTSPPAIECFTYRAAVENDKR